MPRRPSSPRTSSLRAQQKYIPLIECLEDRWMPSGILNLGGFTEPNDTINAGNLQPGSSNSEILLVNNDLNGPAALAIDLLSGTELTRLSQSQAGFAGWTDPADRSLVGDFNGDGIAELIQFNRMGTAASPVDPAIRIIDVLSGQTLRVIRYGDRIDGFTYAQYLNELIDPDDEVFVGHFTQQSRLEALFFNRSEERPGSVALRTIDLVTGQITFSSLHDGEIFGGWTDPTDEYLISDTNDDGYDDLVMINRVPNPEAYRHTNIGFVGMISIRPLPGTPIGLYRGFYRFFDWNFAMPGEASVFPGYDEIGDHAVAGFIMNNGAVKPVMLLINSSSTKQAAYAVLEPRPIVPGVPDSFKLVSTIFHGPSNAGSFDSDDAVLMADLNGDGSGEIVSYSRNSDPAHIAAFDAFTGQPLQIIRDVSKARDDGPPPPPPLPTANAGPDLFQIEGAQLTFNGQATGDGPLTAEWSFGDSSSTSNTFTPSHVYGDDGTYHVTLTVRDTHGQTVQDVAQVTVSNAVPTVQIGGPFVALPGASINFSSSVVDPGIFDLGANATFLWDFGDGSTSSEHNPAHQYRSQGQFTVTLQVTDKDGATGSASTTVTISQDTVAEAGSNVTGAEGNEVQFSGSAQGREPLTIHWDFGDGATTTATLQPRHVYTDNGSYTVRLTVTDADGKQAQDTTTATISNVAPQPNAGGPYSGVAGSQIQFSGNATDPGADDTSTGFSYLWTFGDGNSSTLQNPIHIYASAGEYDVTLQVTDKDGAAGSTSTTATVSQKVGANAGPDRTTQEGTLIQFSGSAQGEEPLSIVWDFGDGATATATLQPSHAYRDNGEYTVTLTVTDAGNRTATDTAVVTVENVAPVADTGGPYFGSENASIQFNGSATDAGPDDATSSFTYFWDFGDGNTSSARSPSHTYASAATYDVSLTVTDKDGAAHTAFTTATVAPQNTILIDPNWLAARGDGPYVLDQENTTYLLGTDVTTNDTAFVVGAANVTLDLNGHTISYGNGQPIEVVNGGFEEGLSDTVFPGWDLSQAQSARRVAARTGMWGDWMLRFEDITAQQVIISDPISIHQANYEHSAVVTPKGSSGTIVRIFVIDATTSEILAGGESSNPNRGLAAIANFVPATTNPIRLRIEVDPGERESATFDIDYVSVTTSREYGIVASRSPHNFPVHLQDDHIQNTARRAEDFTVKNGQIIQGQGRGRRSSPIFAQTARRLTVDKVDMTAGGDDTIHVEGRFATNATVKNSTLSSESLRISNRLEFYGSLQFFDFGGSLTITNNRILDFPQAGIVAFGAEGNSGLLIQGNEIHQRAIVTNGYGIVLDSVQNFEVSHNTIIPVKGRGILIDTTSGSGTKISRNGNIHNNHVEVYEEPNLEFGAGSLEATALRLRSYSSGAHVNLYFHNNSFISRTGPGGVRAAIAARVTFFNGNGLMDNASNRFENNLFKAVVTTEEKEYFALGVSFSGVDANTATTFTNNIFDSNNTSLNFGDNDSFGKANEDVLFVSNTIRKSSEGADRGYRGIVIGDWRNAAHGLRLIDMRYENGATNQLFFVGTDFKDVATGWLLTVNVRNISGGPVANAEVRIVDKDGAEVFRDTTDATGQFTVPVVTTVYRQNSSNPNSIETDDRGPHTVIATLGQATDSEVLDLQTNSTVDLRV